MVGLAFDNRTENPSFSKSKQRLGVCNRSSTILKSLCWERPPDLTPKRADFASAQKNLLQNKDRHFVQRWGDVEHCKPKPDDEKVCLIWLGVPLNLRKIALAGIAWPLIVPEREVGRKGGRHLQSAPLDGRRGTAYRVQKPGLPPPLRSWCKSAKILYSTFADELGQRSFLAPAGGKQKW